MFNFKLGALAFHTERQGGVRSTLHSQELWGHRDMWHYAEKLILGLLIDSGYHLNCSVFEGLHTSSDVKQGLEMEPRCRDTYCTPKSTCTNSKLRDNLTWQHDTTGPTQSKKAPDTSSSAASKRKGPSA